MLSNNRVSWCAPRVCVGSALCTKLKRKCMKAVLGMWHHKEIVISAALGIFAAIAAHTCPACSIFMSHQAVCTFCAALLAQGIWLSATTELVLPASM